MIASPFLARSSNGTAPPRRGCQGERGATIGVTFLRARRPIIVFAVVNDLLHRVQVFAHDAIDRDAQLRRRFEPAPQLRENFALKLVVKVQSSIFPNLCSSGLYSPNRLTSSSPPPMPGPV
jgi:hypothetical protein